MHALAQASQCSQGTCGYAHAHIHMYVCWHVVHGTRCGTPLLNSAPSPTLIYAMSPTQPVCAILDRNVRSYVLISCSAGVNTRYKFGYNRYYHIPLQYSCCRILNSVIQLYAWCAGISAVQLYYAVSEDPPTSIVDNDHFRGSTPCRRSNLTLPFSDKQLEAPVLG